VDDHAAPREERVPVAVHQHALHDRLGQVAGPGAGAAHPPRGDAPGGLLRGRAAAAGGLPRAPAGSCLKPTRNRQARGKKKNKIK
uniref:Uncharacterized protein n=3 Tax=Canis lupus familiaris TaxID=9615 RepID=A0A8C0TLY1_CANLF